MGAGDTIFALSSAVGAAGVAVVRLSGAEAGAALAALAGRLPPARRATVAALADPADGAPLDRALVLWFPAPASFTGEDVAEIHCHGGRAVVDGLLAALGRLPGLRTAEPGEFSRRAFVNGKLDLTAAEGLADLVAAETAAQARQALRQLDGALGALYEGWRERLVRALAFVEAALDFADEDLPAGAEARARADAAAVAREIAAHLDDGGRGERLRAGAEVAVVGPPNAGKSSLVNRLARRDAAIVNAAPGTTRDAIEVRLDLGGVPATVVDTAGLRAAVDPVEREGVRRAEARARRADRVLAVFDAAEWPDADTGAVRCLAAGGIVVWNKRDLLDAQAAAALPERAGDWPAAAISCLTGEGIDRLAALLAEDLGADGAAGAAPPLTRARHRAALEGCAAALARFAAATEAELAAEDLRAAARALGRVTGRADVEDVLDAVFSSFCIGK